MKPNGSDAVFGRLSEQVPVATRPVASRKQRTADRSEMDAWQQSVETHLNGIRSDFRWTWSGMAAMFILLGTMIIGSFLLMDQKVDRLEDKLTARMDRMDAKFDKIDERLNAILERLPPSQKPTP